MRCICDIARLDYPRAYFFASNLHYAQDSYTLL